MVLEEGEKAGVLGLLLGMFDLVVGIRAVSDFDKMDGVGKRGFGALAKDGGVDEGDVRPEFSPLRRLDVGRAEGGWHGLRDSVR